jgi:hypothetical protein
VAIEGAGHGLKNAAAVVERIAAEFGTFFGAAG